MADSGRDTKPVSATSQFWITEDLHLTWVLFTSCLHSFSTTKPHSPIYDKTLNWKGSWSNPARSLYSKSILGDEDKTHVSNRISFCHYLQWNPGDSSTLKNLFPWYSQCHFWLWKVQVNHLWTYSGNSAKGYSSKPDFLRRQKWKPASDQTTAFFKFSPQPRKTRSSKISSGLGPIQT